MTTLKGTVILLWDLLCRGLYISIKYTPELSKLTAELFYPWQRIALAVSSPSILTSLTKARQALKPVTPSQSLQRLVTLPKLPYHLPWSPFGSPSFNLVQSPVCAPTLSQLSLLGLDWDAKTSNWPMADTSLVLSHSLSVTTWGWKIII